MDNYPTPEKIAEVIDLPLKDWPGNCFAVACQTLKAGFFSGRPVYGHYYGPVSEESIFTPGKPVQNHGWIEIDDEEENGPLVIDPTRWAFTSSDPEDAEIVVTTRDDQYDPAGSRLRKAARGPCPSFFSGGPEMMEDYSLDNLSEEARSFLQEKTGHKGTALSSPQLMWVANMPIDELGKHAHEILSWIEEIQSGYIPADHRALVLGKGYAAEYSNE